MSNYVIFKSRAAFDAAHAAAKTAAGLPRVGYRKGILAPESQQTTEITTAYDHPSDGTVVAVVGGEWPNDLKDGFVFKTKAEVADYFPSEE